MSFELNRPPSAFQNPSHAMRSRSLTAFVAVAATRYAHEESRLSRKRRVAWAAAGALVAFYLLFSPNAMGWFGLVCRLTIPLAVLIVIALLTPGVHVFSSPKAAKRVATIRRMNRVRLNVGLEATLDPGLIERFEPVAREWERIENALQSSVWNADLETRERIESLAVDALADLLALNFAGHPVDAGHRLGARMESLATTVEAATNELDGDGVSLETMMRLNSRLTDLASIPSGENFIESSNRP